MGVTTSLILAGLTVSFLHAILPTHWLPFVLAGRAQRWSYARTLGIAVTAGAGHVLMTTALGAIIVYTGVTISSHIESWSGAITGGILALFGGYYIVGHLRGSGHCHHIPGLEPDPDRDLEHYHQHHRHDHAEAGHGKTYTADTVAVGSLIALLTFSPCEAFLPIYISTLPYGWTAFGILAAVLAIGTLGGMLLFTGLTYAGIRKLNLSWLEHYESLLLGVVLLALAVAVYVFDSHG